MSDARELRIAVSGLSVVGTLAPGLPVLRALRSEAALGRGRLIGLGYDPLEPPSYDEALLDSAYLLPYPLHGPERLFERLSYIHERERLDVIIPTLDSELPNYIKLEERLSSLGIGLLIPSAAAFALREKSALPRIAERTGLKVPRSEVADSLDQVQPAAEKLGYPVVVKGNLHGASIVHSPVELVPAAQLQAARFGYPLVLQEYVPGAEFDVAALAGPSSELIGAVPMKKLQLDDRGKAWGAITVEDSRLVEAARRAARGLGWVGAFELELMRDEDTGELNLIELNPRFPAWIHLAGAAGQNLPWALARLAAGEPVPPFSGYRSGVLSLRRSFDDTASLARYESLVTKGEVDLRAPVSTELQPRWIAMPTPQKTSVETAAATAKPAAAAASPAPLEVTPLDNRPARAPYVPPVISRHQQSVVNSFGRRPSHDVKDEIDGAQIAELVEKYGSPLFVFSEKTAREKAKKLREAFTSRYPKLRFSWSYKTNYLDGICRLFHDEGWDAEVVSDLEYHMARRLGIPGSRIVCNGACKPRAWLLQAVREGALVQIDHFDELRLLDEVATEFLQSGETSGPRPRIPVGLRINLTVQSISQSWERFGFNLDNGEAVEALARIFSSRSLRLSGLHCHLGTFIQSPAAYGEATQRLIELLRIAESIGRTRLDYLNLGGGFPSENTLGDRLSAPLTPDIEEYAEAICDELHAAFGEREAAQLPTLVLESGRHLIDAAGWLVATVVGSRHLSSGPRALVLDAGLNVLYTAHWYRHPVVAAQLVPGPLEDTVLLGPLCMNIDVTRLGLPLPPLQPGHRVVFGCVGAYNVTQWMQFSQLRPAVVLVRKDGVVELLRRAETLDDVKGPEPPVSPAT